MPDLPEDFVFIVSAHFGDRLYLVGGTPEASSSFLIYHIASATWETGPDFPTNSKGSVGGLVDGRFLVFCQNLDLVYEFDKAAGAWVLWAGQLEGFLPLSGLVMVDDSHINC